VYVCVCVCEGGVGVVKGKVGPVHNINTHVGIKLYLHSFITLAVHGVSVQLYIPATL
jgi:hypothetical protein